MNPTEKPEKVNLFDYTEEQLLEEHVLTHYQILHLPEYASQDDVKKGYRRASLKYHPDKTGRGDNDYVFLAVKAAHDALYDPAKRQAYDSTTMPFDDSLPSAREEFSEPEFYKAYGPAFTRNLRFDANLRPENKNKKNNKKNQDTGGGGGKKSHKYLPALGDVSTPIEEVQTFYDYWVRFESWRDFSQTAADELQVELEDVESRHEKRWLQKEIDKRAKQLKRKEVARIQTLVERAMEADPRLRRERKARLEAKEAAAKEREATKERERLAAIEQEKEDAVRHAREKVQKAEDKIQREKEKKMVRKARQQLRRMTSASFGDLSDEDTPEGLWKDSYDLSQDVDFLCMSLKFVDLKDLNVQLEEKESSSEALRLVQRRVKEAKLEESSDHQAKNEEKENTKGEKEAKPSTTSCSKPVAWTKEELTALTKSVKKYPPGGSSRWEQISLFVNNLCKQDIPRSKEECIEKYNNVVRHATKNGSSSMPNGTAPAAASNTSAPAAGEDTWTSEQDQQLQDALSHFPTSVEKNERWTSIAKAVPGKNKKQCVQRFKIIRETLQSRK